MASSYRLYGDPMGDTAPVAVVTGASRGAGQGIAAALAGRGWRVYGTGRSIPENPQWGTGVQVDHRDDDAVGRFFDQVAAECGGLDLLVNNAAVISEELVSAQPFWAKPRELADVLDVGLRSSYVAAWHAAPLLLERERGLIVFTSSPGSVCYMHGPRYTPSGRK
jgi:NAD(P)-dependent dehydrogenase (short-subunit alcohol dehydrogenase family)